MSEKKINWNKFRDDAAVKFFAAILSNATLYTQICTNSRFGKDSIDDILVHRAKNYANRLTRELKENKFEENE